MFPISLGALKHGTFEEDIEDVDAMDERELDSGDEGQSKVLLLLLLILLLANVSGLTSLRWSRAGDSFVLGEAGLASLTTGKVLGTVDERIPSLLTG